MVLAFVTLGKVGLGFMRADFYNPALERAGVNMGTPTLLGTLQDLAPMGTGKMDPLPAGELFFFFRVAGFPIAVEQFGITDVLVRQFAEMTPGKKVRMTARYVHGGH